MKKWAWVVAAVMVTVVMGPVGSAAADPASGVEHSHAGPAGNWLP